MKYPGDLLHEAGHLAVTTPGQRQKISTAEQETGWPDGGEEMGAILWSFAALTHIGLPPETVFHADGYKGGSEWLLQSFAAENYIGLPFLEWAGMARSKQTAARQESESFPRMIRWLRE